MFAEGQVEHKKESKSQLFTGRLVSFLILTIVLYVEKNTTCYVYPAGKLFLNSHLNRIFTIRWNNIYSKKLVEHQKKSKRMYIALRFAICGELEASRRKNQNSILYIKITP